MQLRVAFFDVGKRLPYYVYSIAAQFIEVSFSNTFYLEEVFHFQFPQLL